MKITTNFAEPVQRLVKPLLVLSGAISCTAIALTAWMVSDALEVRAELPGLRAQAAHSEVSGGAIPAHQLAAARELAQTRDRIARINAISQTAGVSSSALLTELETLMPSRTWLSRLHYRATEGEVRLVANAANAEPLSEFLMRLEHSDMFEQAMLLREVQQPGDVAAGVQFEIRLKVRSW